MQELQLAISLMGRRSKILTSSKNKKMRKLSIILILVSVAFVFSSCRGTFEYNKKRTMDFAPYKVRLNIDMSNFELLGETVITVDSRTYLGIFKHIDSINGIEYNFRDVKYTKLQGQKTMNLDGCMKKAMYKALDEYPNADYYIPSSSKKHKLRLFLGRQQKDEVVIKAYKFKN